MLGAPHAESVAVLIWCTSGILPYLSAPVSFKRLLDGGPFTTAWPESRRPGGGDAVGAEGIRGSPARPDEASYSRACSARSDLACARHIGGSGSARRLTDRA